MSQKSSPIARVLAIVALLAAAVIVLSVVTGSTGDDDAGKGKNKAAKSGNQEAGKPQKKKVKVYEVQPDDTLTGIAEKNGVTVEEIQELNPDLDPQALQAGAKLKLR